MEGEAAAINIGGRGRGRESRMSSFVEHDNYLKAPQWAQKKKGAEKGLAVDKGLYYRTSCVVLVRIKRLIFACYKYAD